MALFRLEIGREFRVLLHSGDYERQGSLADASGERRPPALRRTAFAALTAPPRAPLPAALLQLRCGRVLIPSHEHVVSPPSTSGFPTAHDAEHQDALPSHLLLLSADAPHPLARALFRVKCVLAPSARTCAR